MPLRSRASYYGVYIGMELRTFKSAVEALDLCKTAEADFVLVKLIRDHGKHFDEYIDIRNVPTSEYNSAFVGCVVPSGIRSSDSRQTLVSDQIEWAVHSGMYAVVLSAADFTETELCDIISGFFVRYPNNSCLTRLWVRCTDSEWALWDTIRTRLSSPSRLYVFIDVNDLSHDVNFDRWLGEPLAAFTIRNRPGTTSFVQECFRRNIQPVCRSLDDVFSIRKCFQECPPLSDADEYVAPYHDSLQLPLQPLAEDMENGIYETFETDRIKYDLYEDAIKKRLQDVFSNPHVMHPTSFHIAIVGAGRGGIVDATLRAVHTLKASNTVSGTTKCLVTAVEKNKNAARSLFFRQRDDHLWRQHFPDVTVNVVHSDMRNWKPEEPVDILVSELLGSFGDNEASPECIDSVICHLRPGTGISIPCSYFSSIEPVSSQKAWMNARDSKHFETPLVVYLHNAYKPTIPQEMFRFEHNYNSPLVGNQRSCVLSWTSPVDMTIHGFAGYFESQLYQDVVMSINPPSKTNEMVSWFPGFLPLTTPVRVCAGQVIRILVERKVTPTKMWMEWTLTAPVLQPTNNLHGSIHSVGL